MSTLARTASLSVTLAALIRCGGVCFQQAKGAGVGGSSTLAGSRCLYTGGPELYTGSPAPLRSGGTVKPRSLLHTLKPLICSITAAAWVPLLKAPRTSTHFCRAAIACTARCFIA